MSREKTSYWSAQAELRAEVKSACMDEYTMWPRIRSWRFGVRTYLLDNIIGKDAKIAITLDHASKS